MGTAYLKPILSAALPSQSRRIHLELVRERGHPEGDMGVAYTITALLWRAISMHAGWRACGLGRTISPVASTTT